MQEEAKESFSSRVLFRGCFLSKGSRLPNDGFFDTRVHLSREVSVRVYTCSVGETHTLYPSLKRELPPVGMRSDMLAVGARREVRS